MGPAVHLVQLPLSLIWERGEGGCRQHHLLALCSASQRIINCSPPVILTITTNTSMVAIFVHTGFANTNLVRMADFKLVEDLNNK